MRPWILSGLALALFAFAATLAVDLFRAEPLEVAPSPANLTSPTEPEPTRRIALERDTVAAELSQKSEIEEQPSLRTAPAPAKEAIVRNPDGSVRSRGALDDHGRQHGPHTSFHPSGAVHEVGEYEQGQKHGLWRSFHENGAQREESTWVNGARRGFCREWNTDGQLVREAQYQGQLEGLSTTWHSSGALESRGQYSGGRREGRWQFWHADGELDPARSGLYRSDQRVGD